MQRWTLGLVMMGSLLGQPCLAGEPVEIPREQFKQMLDSYQYVMSNYVEPADQKKLFIAATRGMLASLDPHSAYLDKDDLDDLERMRTGQYVGIGVQVEVHHGEILIVGVSEDSPADKAGLQSGDSIVAIDGAALFGLRDGQIRRRMRGVPGSTLELTLARRGKTALRTVAVARAQFQGPTVTVQRQQDDIARIRIVEFGGTTVSELVAALRQLDQGTPLKGLILDLRNNPGGMLPSAVGVAGAFMPVGTVVFSAAGRADGASATVSVPHTFIEQAGAPNAFAQLPTFARTVPLVVLVNGASASAAELVAGAIQDHGRGKVVGTSTFGKGSIQTIIHLSDDSALKLTVARYFTPNGHEVQAQGIAPDVVVAPSGAPGDEPGLLREVDMVNHLASTTAPDDGAVHKRPMAEDSKQFGTAADRALKVALAQFAPAPAPAPAPQLSLIRRSLNALLRVSHG